MLTMEKKLDELSRLTQIQVYNSESKKEEIRLIRSAIDQALALSREEIIEECAKVCDDKAAHIDENAGNLRQWEFMADEARCRELGAMYVRENATAIRALVHSTGVPSEQRASSKAGGTRIGKDAPESKDPAKMKMATPAMIGIESPSVAERIAEFLANGGYWNPESMPIDGMHALLLDARTQLEADSLFIVTMLETVERHEKHNVLLLERAEDAERKLAVRTPANDNAPVK